MSFKITSVWVDDELMKEIKILAVINGVSFNGMLEIFLENYKAIKEVKNGQATNVGNIAKIQHQDI